MQNTVTKVAVAHVAPVFLDKKATVSKALGLIQEAAQQGAQLIVFPESFIPGFPIWAALWSPMQNHDLFQRFVENSLLCDGPEVAAIAAQAKKFSIFVSFGLSEASHASVGCIWNSNILISDQGETLVHHRKLVPTFFEKLIWAPGDGAGLTVARTRIGNIGGLICGENTNPLARYALMAQQEQIHISSWPPIWPTRNPTEGGNYNNLQANRIRASAHSFESKSFGIVCAGFMDKPMFEFLVNRDRGIANVLENTPGAESFFVNPTGTQFGDTLQTEEGLIYAELDLSQCIEPKQFHDVVGYYNRFDVFDLKVNRKRIEPITWVNLADDPSN
ncbi:MAG: carbon-nitrogen hydrolase family protein [Alcaligenaceae bacterium]